MCGTRFVVLNRVAEYSGKTTFTLYLLQAIFTPLQGAINAVVYGLNRKVRKEWGRRFWLLVSRAVHAVCGEEKKMIPQGERETKQDANTAPAPVKSIELTVVSI